MRKSSIREEFQTFKIVYSFQATAAARGYHVYINTTWDQAKVGGKVLVEIESDKKSKEIDPYCCSIRTSVNQQIKTDLRVYFFLKDEHGHIDGTVKSIDYRPSPIPAEWLGISFTLNFKSPHYITHTKMKEFMSALYSFDYNGNKEDERNESSLDEEINVLIKESSEESQSDSEVLIQARKKREGALISESSEENQTDSEVVNPKRKTKPLFINETQEDGRFGIDGEYDIVIEK